MKPGKWVIMYLGVKGIDFASFYDFSIWYWNCSYSVVIFVLHFIVNNILAVSFIDGGNQSTHKKQWPDASHWHTLSQSLIDYTSLLE